ncbi:hypothetical protein LC593_34170 [Nostoc sp. CHAB 5844]|nr:hypothetical protein [Nostoc sp. CHAB 5844]
MLEDFQKHKNLLELREIIGNALNEQSNDEFALRKFTIRLIQQFHLHNFDYQEILIESALRAKSKIESGQHILSITAYFRQIVLNVIREYSRKEKRNYQLHQKLSYFSEEEDPAKNLYCVTPKIQVQLERVWQELESKYQMIVYKRAVEGYTFKEIAKELFEQGLEPACDQRVVNNIRQHYYHSLRRLRNQIDNL